MSISFQLYRLQQIDSQLDEARERLTQVEAELSDDQALIQAKTHYDQRFQALEASRRETLKAEEAVKAQRVKIEQTEATLYSGKVHNPKELQDLQNEVAALKRYLSVLEDRQLEQMLLEEQSQEESRAAQSAVEKLSIAYSERNARLNEEQNKLNKNIARLEEERHAALQPIEEDNLRRYELLRHSRKGIAVAKVVDKCCAACGSTLNAMLLYSARSPNQITICDTCGRILYAG